MRTHATSCIGETSLRNCQKTKESLRNIGIFLLLKPDFPHTKFDFLQQLSTFFNGFPIFLNGFLIFLNGFPIFLNGFPLSEKSEKIYSRQEVYERSLFELRIFATRSPTRAPSFVIPATIPNTLLWCTCVPNIAPYLISKLKYNLSRI